MKKALLLPLGIVTVAAIAYQGVTTTLLPTGKTITPVGKGTDVGSFPCNMAASPDGRFIVVTDSGFRQALTVLDAKTGDRTFQTELPDNDGLYYGLVFGKGANGETLLYASHGDRDRISIDRLGDDGRLVKAGDPIRIPEGKDNLPRYVAGLALSEDGSTLYAVENESYAQTGFAGGVAVIDLASKKVVRTLSTPGFPMAIACAHNKLFVTSEMEGCVAVLDPDGKRAAKVIRVGAQPVGLTLGGDKSTLYVAVSGSDSVVAIDTDKETIVKRLLLRPTEVRGLSGCTPLSVALSTDGKILYVPMADWNAVGVVDVADWKVTGFVPVGWYPTSVVATPDRLFVANARGLAARNANSTRVNGHGTYILSILEGAVSSVDLGYLAKNQGVLTAQALSNNRVAEAAKDWTAVFKNPGIDYVIYVIKENRTYDQVLGDLPQGDGDPNLCLFGADVTPNQHALARRFGLNDNFFVCAEVSADGWEWSTAGMANEYTSRNTATYYSGRGRDYDFEGESNGSPVEFEGRSNVAENQSGYLWDLCQKHGVSYRNYGFYLAYGDSKDKDGAGEPVVKDNQPVYKALLGHTCADFLKFDTSYADSNAWKQDKIAPPKSQLAAYGHHRDPSRFDVWKREYEQDVKSGEMPKFMMVRFMRDHTAGTDPGASSPRAMVADNDYAVGQLVQTVSHSPYWKHTAIFIVEDDAQAGQDHVDAHRSLSLVISPYADRGVVRHAFYNTDSVLHTMELLLGLPPMNQFDAIATPMPLASAPANIEPYDAVLPSRDILAEVNRPTAYRSLDSERLLSRTSESDVGDLALNDILWHAIKGANVPMPQTPGLQVR